MSEILTAEQVELHRQNLASLTDFQVFPVLTETALFAIFTILIITSSYILITRGLASRTSKIMLTITLILYGLSTWDWAIDVLLLRDELKVLLPGDLVQPPPDHRHRVQVNSALRISQAITNNISSMVSDSVVVWRVYVVYGGNKRVLAIGIALLTALFSSLLLCNLTQIGIGFPSVVNLHLLAPGELAIDITALILSALVNIWATAMIAYQAWRCRRNIRRYLKDTTRRSFAESILILFTETGTVYTSLWILKNIIIIPQVMDTSYTIYASVIMYQMTGMYPTVLIILVALHKSHLESQFTSYGGTTSSKDIVFVSGPTSATAVSSTGHCVRSGFTFTNLIMSEDIMKEDEIESRTDLGSKDGHEGEAYAM
ncbi:hypothetical protein L218DRAFT_1081347 [Marasmius fiardii PR-910]|nr:hypothetical protein L218DRAFT_1081347 [Marasmius fiardii PR-910]